MNGLSAKTGSFNCHPKHSSQDGQHKQTAEIGIGLCPAFEKQTFGQVTWQPMFGMTCAEGSRSSEGHNEERTADGENNNVNTTELPCAHIMGTVESANDHFTADNASHTTSTSGRLLARGTSRSETNAFSLLAPVKFKPTQSPSGQKFQPIRDNVFCSNHTVKYNKPVHQHHRKRRRRSRGAPQPEAEKQKSNENSAGRECLVREALVPGTPPWERGVLLPPLGADAIKHLLCSGRYSTTEITESDGYHDDVNEVSSLVHPGPDTHTVPVTYSGASQYPEPGTDRPTHPSSIQYPEPHTVQTAPKSIDNNELDTESVPGTNSGHCQNSETFTDQTLHEGGVGCSEMNTEKITRFEGIQYSERYFNEGNSLTYPLDEADSDSGIEEELEYLLRPSEDSSSSSDDEGDAASNIVDPNQETCSVKVVVEASVHYPPARVICDESPDEIHVTEVFYLRSPEAAGRQSRVTERHSTSKSHRTDATKTVSVVRVSRTLY